MPNPDSEPEQVDVDALMKDVEGYNSFQGLMDEMVQSEPNLQAAYRFCDEMAKMIAAWLDTGESIDARTFVEGLDKWLTNRMSTLTHEHPATISLKAFKDGLHYSAFAYQHALQEKRGEATLQCDLEPPCPHHIRTG